MSLIQKFAIIASILVGPLMFCWEEAQAADNSKTPAKVDVITICYAAADLCFRTCQLAAGSGNANCDQGCERSLAIVEVGGVPETSLALGIGQSTVKTHLGHLYAKTGTHRQSDLVKLVAGFSNPLRHKSDHSQ